MITIIIVAVIVATIVLFVLSWMDAAGTADEDAERVASNVLDPVRERIDKLRKDASGTGP